MSGNTIAVGVVGGAVPVLVSFVQTDLAVLEQNGGGTAWLFYLLRVAAIVALGVIGAWIHENTIKGRFGHVSAASAAPALLAAFLSNDPTSIGNEHRRFQLTIPVFAASVAGEAEQGAETQNSDGIEEFTRPMPTFTQKALLGLFGIRPHLPEYFVEISHEANQLRANGRMEEVRNSFPAEADLRVFRPSAGINEWVVTYGGQLDLDEGLRLLEQVQESYSGAQLRRMSRVVQN